MSGWPFVGRDAEQERIARLLAADPPTSVLIAGEQGVGKTRLAAAAREQATAAGFEVRHVLAGSATRAIPFGALATLLPVIRDVAENSQATLGAAAAALTRLGDERPLLISVDDAHHLDDPSAAVLHQIGSSGGTTILLTVRADLELPDPVRALWRSGAAERIDLGPLGTEDIETVLELVLGGTPAPRTVAALARLSEGNVLYLRELVEGSLAGGSLREDAGLWHLDEPSTTPRLAEIIEERLALLDHDARHGLELVTVAGIIGYRALTEAVGEDAVETLEVQGLVTVSSDRQRRMVTVGHPIHAEVVRDALSTRRLRERNGEVADIIEQRGVRRRDDTLRVAVARLESGGEVSPELMTEAARRALGAYDLALGERLARVALAAGGGIQAGLALASALARMGRQKEADRAFARIDTTGASDEDRASVAIEWAESRFWGLDDHPGAKALLAAAIDDVEDPEWRDRLVITGAAYDLLMGRAREALAAVEHIREIGTPRGIAAVALVAAPALQLLGRGEEAMSGAGGGRAPLRRARRPHRRGVPGDARGGDVPGRGRPRPPRRRPHLRRGGPPGDGGVRHRPRAGVVRSRPRAGGDGRGRPGRLRAVVPGGRGLLRPDRQPAQRTAEPLRGVVGPGPTGRNRPGSGPGRTGSRDRRPATCGCRSRSSSGPRPLWRWPRAIVSGRPSS